MDNESFFKNLRLSYDSLNYFVINNNTLYYKNNDKIYSLPLTNINLSNLNPNIYLLSPNNIFRILYTLEILRKDEITDNETNYIVQYVNSYLKAEKERIENNSNNENELMCLSIPIYSSYDPELINKPASKIIQEQLNNYTDEMESGKSHGQKLVLTNPNFPVTHDETDITDLGKAGYTVTMLIVITVILTSLYIAFFILNK